MQHFSSQEHGKSNLMVAQLVLVHTTYGVKLIKMIGRKLLMPLSQYVFQITVILQMSLREKQLPIKFMNNIG